MIEDFTTYTETDPGSKITVTSTKVDVAAIPEQDSARVYSDKGANHFSGDFEHLITVYCSSSTVTGIAVQVWAVSNITTLKVSGEASTGIRIRMYEETSTTASLFLNQYNVSGTTDTNTSLSLNTPYYLKIKRDEAVGTYGTAYCYIYSDSGRTTLVDTLTVTISTSKVDYQYVYAFANWGNEDGAYSWTGYTENLDLQEGVTSTPYRRRSNLALLGVS